jgi:hypothetical protein
MWEGMIDITISVFSTLYIFLVTVLLTLRDTIKLKKIRAIYQEVVIKKMKDNILIAIIISVSFLIGVVVYSSFNRYEIVANTANITGYEIDKLTGKVWYISNRGKIELKTKM